LLFFEIYCFFNRLLFTLRFLLGILAQILEFSEHYQKYHIEISHLQEGKRKTNFQTFIVVFV